MDCKDNESMVVSELVFPTLPQTNPCRGLLLIYFESHFLLFQSTMTVQTDGEGGGFITDSTIGDTTSVVSVQSSVSTRSSRSGLTRQGNRKHRYGWSRKRKASGCLTERWIPISFIESTFRPLNSGKKPEKGKKKRRQRKTIGGIPQHVQMELGV